jgi:hypothetical protein
MKLSALGIWINLLAWSLYGQANVVTDWAAIVQPAINNAAAPCPPGSSEVLHTTIALAVYDAVNKVPRPSGSRSGGDEKNTFGENSYVAPRIGCVARILKMG